MRTSAIALAFALLLAAVAEAQEEKQRTISGNIGKDTAWSGRIHLTGDITVAAGVTLHIEPGTTITAEPLSLPRGYATDWDLRPELIEIHVFGGIEVRGTDEKPVRLGVPPQWKEEAEGKLPLLLPSWLGIVLQPERDGECEFRHCIFRGALGAIQVSSGSPEIVDCTFLSCSIGVSAGTAWGDRKGKRRVLAKLPGPGILRCRFGRCDTGIYLDGEGRPTVERTVFLDCRIGIGRWAGGMTYPMRGLGPLVERCDFLYNRIALYGSNSARNNIFFRNRLAFAASSFHRVYATHIDRYHRTHNTYFENDRLVNGDIPLGEAARFTDPGYRRAVEKSAALLLTKDLRSFLGLRSDSTLVGGASDGGDPGSFGAVGTMKKGRAGGLIGAGVSLGPWLAPGPASHVTDEGVAALKQAIRRTSGRGPAPGRKLGRAIYALLPVKSGLVRLTPELLPGSTDFVLVAAMRAEDSGRDALHLGLDGLLIEAFWNGTNLRVPKNGRRFVHGDLTWPVAVRRGVNYLLIRGRLSAPGARIAAHLTGNTSLMTPEVWPAPATATKPMLARIAAAAKVGRRPGRMTIYLTVAPYWPDVVRPSTWSITGDNGSRLAAAPGDIEYDSGKGRVVLHNLPLEKGVEYTLAAEELRDAWGRPRAASAPHSAVAR